MTTLTIELSDERMRELVARAALGVTPEDWVRTSIEERLDQPLSDEARRHQIQALTQQLFNERAEVYRALAEGAQ